MEGPPKTLLSTLGGGRKKDHHWQIQKMGGVGDGNVWRISRPGGEASGIFDGGLRDKKWETGGRERCVRNTNSGDQPGGTRARFQSGGKVTEVVGHSSQVSDKGSMGNRLKTNGKKGRERVLQDRVH